MNFSIKSYQGRAIRINPVTRYVCLTDMATASCKRVSNWTQLKSFEEFSSFLSSTTGITVVELLVTTEGRDGGTWAHPKLAIQFAQWCSPVFALQVSDWIDELMTTGKVKLATQPKPLLIEQSKVVAKCVDDIQNLLSKSNPRLAQLLIDIGVNDFIEQQQSRLPASKEFPEDRWYSLVSIADKMGIKTNASSRVKLGLYVGKIGLERIQEERLCNNEMRPIWCYRDDEATRQAIEGWISKGE